MTNELYFLLECFNIWVTGKESEVRRTGETTSTVMTEEEKELYRKRKPKVL